MADSSPNRVNALFADKTILVTGGTGFLGKVLIEKLLRSCNSLKKIYVIVRPKNGETANDRLGKIFTNPLFDSVKKQYGSDVIKKVEAVSGDVGASDLGLSPADRGRVVQETEIIYHSAATVRFDQSLKFTVLLNVRGTRSLLELAKMCRHLEVFCHISTAFCHENEEVIGEKFYPPPTNPHDVITLCEQLEELDLEKTANKMRGLSANNYSFSKALAEALIEEYKDQLPLIIQRPTVVLPTWKEPIPGWTDNINGPTGLFIAGGKGVLRTMYTKTDKFINSCPVDVVVNKIIVNTFYYLTFRTQQVFNVIGPIKMLEEMPIQEVIDISAHCARHKCPYSMVLWYPNMTFKSSRIHHYFDFVLFRLLPALIIDMILYITGNKTFLLRVQKRIWKSYQILEYYLSRRWNFEESSGKIHDVLNAVEMEAFNTKIDDFDKSDYENYIEKGALGTRRYIFKETVDISADLKRMRMMRYLDLGSKVVIVITLGYYIFSKIMFLLS